MHRARTGEARRTVDGDQPERTCIVTRAKRAPDDLIRFVAGPDGAIVPDLARKLPGRGVWVTCNRAVVAAAVRGNAFARSLKMAVKVPDDLAARVEVLLVRRAVEALSLANKAGLVVPGFTKAESVVAKGGAMALIHAREAADDGVGKLVRRQRAVQQALGLERDVTVVRELSSEELSLAMGRPHVVHAALEAGGAAENFLCAARRLGQYRAEHASGTAQPSKPRLDTEQA